MTETILKTDLSSLEVTRDPSGDTASPVCYLQATYWCGCPLPRDSEMLCLGSHTFLTHILSAPGIKPAEPGFYYRLPPVACEAIGVDEPLALVPFLITIEHSPCTGFAIDEGGCATPVGGEADTRVHTTALWAGSTVLCGLFRPESAAKWAALPPHAWLMPPRPFLERSYGLDTSWINALCTGAVCLKSGEPLLTSHVEVCREKA